MRGGQCGARGVNLVKFAPRVQEDGTMTECKVVSLGGKNTIQVLKNDCLTILSPGGGGYGESSKESPPLDTNKKDEVRMTSGSLYSYQISQETA